MQDHFTHTPITRRGHPGHLLPNRRLAGGAAPWLIFVVVVLSVLGALALWGPGRGGPTSTETKDSVSSPADSRAVTGELEELGDRFGQVMENQRDVQPLIDRVDTLIAQQPDLAGAHTLRGQVLLYAGRPQEALAAFQVSLKLEPRQAGIHRIAGNLAMKLQRYDQARHHYQQAMSIEPGHGENAVFLANVQLKLNEDDQATTTLLAALRRNSELHSAYALLSDVYAKKNKPQLALDQIQRAIESAPDDNPNIRTLYTLKRAALLRRDNRPAEALALLEGLPPGERLKPHVLQDTATCWAMLGKPGMAAELYERVLKADPSSDLAAAQAARWRIKAGDLDTASQHIQTLRRINPRHDALIGLESKLRETGGVPVE